MTEQEQKEKLYQKMCEYEKSLLEDAKQEDAKQEDADQEDVDQEDVDQEDVEHEKDDTQQDSKKKKKKRDPARYRVHSLISYIPYSALLHALPSFEWVQHWAMCYHDKDVEKDGTPKPAHTHIILYTYNGKSSSAMRKIFDRYARQLVTNTDMIPQNTLWQKPRDMVVMWRYLLHLDDPDKYQYPMRDRVCDNASYWTRLEATNGMNDSKENKALQIINDLRKGVSYYTMVERYGQNFVIHRTKYEQFVNGMRYADFIKNQLSVKELFKQTIDDCRDITPLDEQVFFEVLDKILDKHTLTYGDPIDYYLHIAKEIEKNA